MADGGIQMSPAGVTAVSLMHELARDDRLPVQADKCEIVKGLAPSWHYVAEAVGKYWSEIAFELTVNIGSVSARRM